MRTEVYRELRRAHEIIEEFNDRCEEEGYTDTSEAWEVIDIAYNAIDNLLTPRKERRPGQEPLDLN